MNKSSSGFAVNWVLINEIAIGRAPRKREHLERIQKKNINSILSLCDIEEAPPPKEMTQMFCCERIVLPDHRKGIEPSINDFLKALKLLENLRVKGSVYVHCVAAMERSPLVCLGWLMRKNKLTLQQSLDYLMQVHKGTNPLPEQLELLKKI